MKYKVILKLLFSLIALTFSLSSQAASLDKNKKPNFLIIMADDVSPDLYGAYGLPAAANTPNIDKLAEAGVMFKTAYATAMCGPTRAEIMTGRYAQTTGAYHNSVWLGRSHKTLYSDNIAFAKPLSKAGYATAITGKWHAGAQEPYEDVVGFDESCLWSGEKEIARHTKKKFDGAYEDGKTTSRYWNPAYICNGELHPTAETNFGPDIEAAFLIDFISRQAKADKPFLAYWPTVAPHGTRKGQSTTPHRGKIGEMGKAKGAEGKARFKALNEYLDHLVGKVVDHLEVAGVADNTIIMFLSDNGTAVTAKTRGVERGPHVVSIMAGKGFVKQRGATDELMDFSDIFPTLVDYAGAKNTLPKGYKLDGKSLKPFLSGKSDSHRDWIYGYISGSQILRTKTHLLEVVNPILGMPDGRFYYTGDNRFWSGYERAEGNPEHAAALTEMKEILSRYSPLTRDNAFFQTRRGKKFLKKYESPKKRGKHLHNHKDYRSYDESD